MDKKIETKLGRILKRIDEAPKMSLQLEKAVKDLKDELQKIEISSIIYYHKLNE